MASPLRTVQPETKIEALSDHITSQVVLGGDLSRLSEQERVQYYNTFCESLHLNPLSRPFAYLRLNGKLVLYAQRDCADQLRRINDISITVRDKWREGDIYIVSVEATTPKGRRDEDMGAVNLKGKAGDDLANAFLRCLTKAKRRVTLSICGLGILDETEVQDIPGAEQVSFGDITKGSDLGETNRQETKTPQAPDTSPETESEQVEYTAGKRYEGKITNLQYTKRERGSFGVLSLNYTYLPDLYFFTRPPELHLFPPTEWETLIGEDVTFSFKVTEKEDKTWYYLDELEFQDNPTVTLYREMVAGLNMVLTDDARRNPDAMPIQDDPSDILNTYLENVETYQSYDKKTGEALPFFFSNLTKEHYNSISEQITNGEVISWARAYYKSFKVAK